MKHQIEIKHQQTYRLYVSANNETDAKSNAVKMILSEGSFKTKYLIDDNVEVSVINLKGV